MSPMMSDSTLLITPVGTQTQAVTAADSRSKQVTVKLRETGSGKDNSRLLLLSSHQDTESTKRE